MRKAQVFRNGVQAGILTETEQRTFEFRYSDAYFNDDSQPAISLTLPKKQQLYTSDHLFPFFYNMLSEGMNRAVQLRQLKIDQNDFFGLLLATARYETTGAVTVRPNNEG